MKKLALLLFIPILMMSCSSDDNDTYKIFGIVDSTIIGEWKPIINYTYLKIEHVGDTIVLNFKDHPLGEPDKEIIIKPQNGKLYYFEDGYMNEAMFKIKDKDNIMIYLDYGTSYSRIKK